MKDGYHTSMKHVKCKGSPYLITEITSQAYPAPHSDDNVI